MKQKKQFSSVLLARGAIENIATWFGGLRSYCIRLSAKDGSKNVGLQDLTPSPLMWRIAA